MKRRSLAITTVVLVLSLAEYSDAQTDQEAALSAANEWLKLVDDGNLSASWATFSFFVKSRHSEAEWQRLFSSRQVLGALTSRELRSSKLYTALPTAPPGDYVNLRFVSRFAHSDSVLEIVVTVLDDDNVWRVAGYWVPGHVPATEGDQASSERKAIASAREWLELLDSGDYTASWDESAYEFRNLTKKDDWFQCWSDSANRSVGLSRAP